MLIKMSPNCRCRIVYWSRCSYTAQ